ncbi:MAG: EcoRII N-terminal effector-binding domain-containing protein [Devosia sp.]
MKKFIKSLSANDVGSTGAHMAGILVPKSDGELLAFLPQLDPTQLNPSAWIECVAPDGTQLRLRFVYYNNRHHTPGGTRNEYRITHLTGFLRNAGAKEGELFEISQEEGCSTYRIRVINGRNDNVHSVDAESPLRIKLTSGWKRMH